MSKADFTVDWSAVRVRLESIASELGIPTSEVNDAMKCRGKRAGPIVDFSGRYGLSIDWLLMGTGSPFRLKGGGNA